VPFSTVLHPECEKELLELKKQNDELLTKVIHDLALLREFGLELLGEDRVKKLKPDLFELRTRRGSDINRILFGLKRDRIILLATSFVKKTQQTPAEKIEMAVKRLAEWED
jgi:phage-related protein